MDRQELADYLGVARPSLSRALMKMQTEGLIEVH
ncbi:MAG: helix-turn-helix domain-containing protein [Eubacterium sp.]|nr:helix-turn-helix domain-containing protein [Eubacterium sp.]